jgi:hypothetical protein
MDYHTVANTGLPPEQQQAYQGGNKHGPALEGVDTEHKATQVNQITFCIFPYTTEQDSQSMSILISKQVIQYRTRGGTYCPGVSTHKIQCIADSSNHKL